MNILSVEEVIATVWQLREKHPFQDTDKLEVVISTLYRELFKVHMLQRVTGMNDITHIYGMKINWSEEIETDNIIVGISSKK